jgi:hypothetical protein
MRRLVPFFPFPLAAATVFGAGAPAVDYSGRWIVNPEKTAIEGLPVYVVAIKQDPDTIDVVSYFPGKEEAPVRTMVLPLDGREVTYSDRNGEALPCSALLSGESFEDYVERNIFTPLAMSESSFSKQAQPERNAPPCERAVGPALSILERSVPLTRSLKAAVRDEVLTFPLYDLSPGPVGVRATAVDLARFLAVHTEEGRTAEGRPLLKTSTIDLMHAVAVPAPGAAIDIFPLVGQGMGWAVCTEGVSGHIGGQLGYTSAMILKRTERGLAGFILLMNYARRLDPDSQANLAWFKTYYAPLERRLLDAAEACPSSPETKK